MEDGTTAGGSDNRRKTISGTRPTLDEHDVAKSNMKGPWSSPSAPVSPQGSTTSPTGSKQSGHKRSVSGSLLAKFNFLKGVVEDAPPLSPREKEKEKEKRPQSPTSAKSRKSIDDDEPTVSPVSPVKGESALAAALTQATKTRKRKGSLRKTALLGTRRLVTETRERRNSILNSRSPPAKEPLAPFAHSESSTTAIEDIPEPSSIEPDLDSIGNGTRSKFSYENVEAASSTDSGWSESAAATAARLSTLLTESRAQQDQLHKDSSEPFSPLDLKSPISNASYASTTTDDDDVLTFDRPANSFAVKKPISSTSTSYFPSVSSVSDTSLARRVSSKGPRSSPLSRNITTLSSYSEPDQHDYTETEYWGWVILFATWLTFAVGMGSCLEVWSWAWDVGEKPYAPAELEDDSTLPIVGYYPALMVLSGVAAWVWITIAWIGMKYFRHAKIDV